ncbi:MAG: FecR family protein [Cyclobacteriaceae bacterium]
MSKEEFYAKLKKYLRGKLSEPEKEKVNQWLDALGTPEESGWSESDQKAVFEKIKNKINKSEKSMPSNNIFWLKVAASVTITIALSYLIITALKPEPQRLRVEKVFLNDGTIVWLKPHSKLTYYETADSSERHASLTGEALFEVAKKDIPFFLDCGKNTIRVMGTSFSIRSSGDSLELKVLTGRVKIFSASNPTGIEAGPNEKVIDTSNGLSKLSMNPKDKPTLIPLSEYDMDFQNTPMTTVLQRLEKKFNITINVADPQMKACRITADFTDQSLQNTLLLIAEILEVEFVITESTVQITGSGCK